MEVKRIVIYSLTVIIILLTGYVMSDYFIDSSQTTFEAQKKGAPATDKVWTLQEYEMFFHYLSVLPEDIDYPVLSSGKSGKLFQSFINSLDDVLYAPLKEELLFMQTIKLKLVCQKILKLYIDKDIKVQKYKDEVAYLYGIQIQILSQMQEIAERSVRTLQKENENRQLQMKGLELMKQGATVQISVILDLLSEQGAFKDNETLLLYFKQYVPELLHFFDQQRKDIIKQRIVDVSKNADLSSTKNILNDIASGL